MGTLGRYIIAEVLRTTLLVMLALLGVFLFFDLILEIGSLGRGSYSLGRVVLYVLLRSPGHAYELLPIGSLIGGLFALSFLNQSSEYTVMRIGGLSLSRVLVNLSIAGALLAGATVLIGEYVAPNAERAASQLRLSATGQVVAQDFRSGFWSKDGLKFINVREVLPDNSLRNVAVYEFDAGRKLQRITTAERGVWIAAEKQWLLTGATATWFQPERIWFNSFPEVKLPTAITPETLAVLLVVPEQMSARNLASYVKHLQANQQKAKRYEIALWSKRVYPLACLAMLMIALPFAQTQRRAKGVGPKLFIGIMLGLGFYFVNKLFGHLGLRYDWHPIAAATIPSAVFLLLAMAMLWWQERR